MTPPMMGWVLPLLVAVVFCDVVSSFCLFCSDGSPISLPEKSISIPGVPFITKCGDAIAFLPLVDENSTECAVLQSVESICGCPVAENACQLCGNRNKTLEMAYPQRELDFVSFLFDGVVPTCELYAAYLQTFSNMGNECTAGQEFLGDYCGCNSEEEDEEEDETSICTVCPDGRDIVYPDVEINIAGFPFRNCGELEQVVNRVLKVGSAVCDVVQSIATLCGCRDVAPPEPCALCWDGVAVPEPDRPAPWARDIFLGIIPTCLLLEAYVEGTYAQGDNRCDLAQSAGTFCGCRAQIETDHCLLCPQEDGVFSSEAYAQQSPPVFAPLGTDSIDVTCELVETIQYSNTPQSGLCLLGQELAHECGCDGGNYHYLGTKSSHDRVLLTSLLRISAALSILGFLAIQFDILLCWYHSKKANTRSASTTNTMEYSSSSSSCCCFTTKLVWCLSIFDGIMAIAMIVGPAAMPDVWDDVFGTFGDETTCRTQGFFVQLGSIVSVCYSTILILYFKLILVNGWEEQDSTRRRRTVVALILPVVFGLAMAGFGLPFYGAFYLVSSSSGTALMQLTCHLNPLPLSETYVFMIPLQILPIMLAMLVMTVLILHIFFSNRSQPCTKAKTTVVSQVPNDKSKGKNHHQEEPSTRTFLSSFRSSMFLDASLKTTVVEKDTAYQAILFGQAVAYVVVFYVTWMMVLIGIFQAGFHGTKSAFWFWCLVAVAAPLQGFLHACVYFYPRILHKNVLSHHDPATSLLASNNTQHDDHGREEVIHEEEEEEEADSVPLPEIVAS